MLAGFDHHTWQNYYRKRNHSKEGGIKPHGTPLLHNPTFKYEDKEEGRIVRAKRLSGDGSRGMEEVDGGSEWVN